MPENSMPEPVVGDQWVAVSANGKGQPVRVVGVNGHHVYFQAIGRGTDQSQKYKLPLHAFGVRYAPVKMADDRQKRMALHDRTYPNPKPLGEPAPEPIPAPVASPVSSPVSSPVRSPYRKLTDEQAREIYQLVAEGGNRREIGAAYGVLPQTVHDIWNGKSYHTAVADLLQARGYTGPRTFEEEPMAGTANNKFVTINQEVSMPDGPVRDLLTDMAEALELLLEYHGKPVPRFVVINKSAIQSVLDKARVAVGSSHDSQD